MPKVERKLVYDKLRESLDKETETLGDADYLWVLDMLETDIQGMVEAKRSEMEDEEE